MIDVPNLDSLLRTLEEQATLDELHLVILTLDRRLSHLSAPIAASVAQLGVLVRAELSRRQAARQRLLFAALEHRPRPALRENRTGAGGA